MSWVANEVKFQLIFLLEMPLKKIDLVAISKMARYKCTYLLFADFK